MKRKQDEARFHKRAPAGNQGCGLVKRVAGAGPGKPTRKGKNSHDADSRSVLCMRKANWNGFEEVGRKSLESVIQAVNCSDQELG
jgi:hypothetical protein